MGKYRNTGLFKYKKKESENLEVKYDFDLRKEYTLEDGIKELEKINVKFYKEDVYL